MVEPGKHCEGGLLPIQSRDDCLKAGYYLREYDTIHKEVYTYTQSVSNDKPFGCISIKNKNAAKHRVVWNEGGNKTNSSGFEDHSKIQPICRREKL